MKLVLSHSSTDNFELCRQLYKYRYVDQLATHQSRLDADFGVVMHAGLAAWHRHSRLAPAKAAYESLAGTLLKDDLSDHRTKAFGLGLLTEYAGFYTNDTDIAKVVTTERAFSIKIGAIGAVEVFFAGTIDIGMEDHQRRLCVLDHKTTTLGWPLFWSAQTMSDQWPGYILGLREFTRRQDCDRVIVNYINTRARADERFRRGTVVVEEGRIAEWREAMMGVAGDILACHADGKWRQFRSACTRQFGKVCEFYEVCACPADRREEFVKKCADFGKRQPGPTERKFKIGWCK